MMIKTLKTTTGKLTLGMPETLSEVSLGQLIELQSAHQLSDFQAISILSGTPLEALQNIVKANDLQVFSRQVAAVAGQLKHLYNVETIPREITFLTEGQPRKVKVIKNLSVEPAGAFMAAREVIADEINRHITQYGEPDWQQHFSPSLQACAQVLAQYFYCPATGRPYNEYAAAQFEEQAKLLPVTEALPLAKYFFLNYPNLSKPRTGFWQRLQRRWSNAPASAGLRRSNTSTPLMPLAAAM